MKKGIVMDVNDDYVTMLTPDGEFVKAKHTKTSYEIGEEITCFPIDERVRNVSKPRFFQVRKWRYAVASSLVAILFLSLFIPFSSRDEVYAYMSIDINPSFEVGLDENLQVISIEALNDEAKKLLESIPDWKNSTLDSITEKIIENSKDSGYLKGGKQVLITTVVTDSHNTDVDRELEQGIEEIKEEYKKEQIAVTSITSTVETRKAAQEKGISTGKLLIEEDKVPKPVEEQKAQPARQEKENQQEKAVEQKEINEFRNNQKQKAEEVQEELKEKKEQIKEKVKNNIENSNMPAHLKEEKIEKIEEKWEKKQQKQEEKERKKEEREQRKENNNRGKDRNHDHDDD
ncbi:anti-sigma factor domain-containing protein [Fredinandcohnia onubensis]|uniref:anti-sigma factor domain-containing protein n=1 Tax=Fredinandcohnia onubensis TaxID=1571209 RepID=UPI000C0BC385|nr:anti-sigma factor domain-containing protein [Fredinandcohnia onubensis]